MSRAVLLALLSGVLLGAAIAELALARHARARTAGRATRRRAAVRLLAALGRRLGPLAPPGDLAARMAAAGMAPAAAPGEVMAVKAGAAAAALLALLPLSSAVGGRAAVLLLAGAGAGGFLAPDLWLRRRARARGIAMARELPELLELLRVAAAAGLPPARALAEVGARGRGPLASELTAAARALRLGEGRRDVLDRLVARCPLEGAAALAAALDRAARHGGPLAPALAAQAAEARAARARALREAAATAAPKIQLAVALLLVPSAMLVVAAALLATLTGG
jgi:tight adherence protein C